MTHPTVGVGWKLKLQKCGFHFIFYDFDNNGVPSMRKVSDLVITLENKKGKTLKLEQRKSTKQEKV